MRTLAPVPSLRTEDSWSRRADEVCLAWLAFERARLDGQSIPTFTECVELEIDARQLETDWDTYFERDAGPWRQWCTPELLKELERLEALGAQPPWDELTEAVEDEIYIKAQP